ncbi:hypothetical protein D3C87_1912230 [compost metagenome]
MREMPISQTENFGIQLLSLKDFQMKNRFLKLSAEKTNLLLMKECLEQKEFREVLKADVW